MHSTLVVTPPGTTQLTQVCGCRWERQRQSEHLAIPSLIYVQYVVQSSGSHQSTSWARAEDSSTRKDEETCQPCHAGIT